MNFKRFLITFGILSSTLLGQTAITSLVTDITVEGVKKTSWKELPPIPSLHSKVGYPLLEDDLEKDIHQFYLTGYFQEIAVTTTPNNQGIRLTFKVTENPTIKDVTITGNRALSSFRLRHHLSSKKGETLNLRKLNDDKDALELLYIEKGYTLTEIDTISVDTQNRLAIKVSEAITGDTYFEGLKKIKPFVLERELRLKPGTPFNTIHLRQDRDRLYRLGFFANVTLPALETAVTGDKVINVRYGLQERKVNMLDFGLEQRQNIVVTFLRTDFHHVLAHSDLVTIKIQAQPNINNDYRIRSYRVSYHQPWFLNRYRFSFTTNGWTDYNQEFQTSDRSRKTIFHTQRNGYDVGLGFPLIRDRLMLTTRLKNEDVKTELGTSPSFAPYRIQSLNAGLSYSKVDNILNPHIGGYWAGNIERGGNLNLIRLNGLNFTRFTVNAAGFVPVSTRGTFAARTFAGAYLRDEVSIGTFDAEGFVLGGANSLRGYKEFQNPLTGTKEVLFNLEYRYQFSQAFQGVLFYDMGQTYNGSFTVDVSQMRTGYGCGIRFVTALAPIRFDFSWGEFFLIQFGLGHMF